MKANRPPSDGLQFFGMLNFAAASKVLTAKLHNIAGQEIYSVDLEPA
jgi:alkaline phosphatase D